MSGTLRMEDLSRPERVRPVLEEAGLSPAAVAAKSALLGRAAGALEGRGGGGPGESCAFWVPGRIEVLGKHTDYAGGRSLLAATERGFCMVGIAREDRAVHVTDAATGARVETALDPGVTPRPGRWSNYPMTVVRRVARNFPEARKGVDLAFASDLPQASGMSSSSAMMVGFFLILSEINGLSETPAYRQAIRTPEDLAGYLGTIENGQSFGALVGDRGVGTFGGSEDHTAMLCSRPGRLSQYAYCPVRLERRASVPDGYVFAVGFSGVVAEKTGAAMEKYNRASGLAAAAAAAWRLATESEDPHLAAALARADGRPEPVREALRCARDERFPAKALVERFEHFYAENEEILPAAADALDRGDLAGFGREVDRSQDLGEKLLKNQVPETVFLAASARELGAAAASAFGAGFGGSVWALVPEEGAGAFLEQWQDRFVSAFPEPGGRSTFFTTGAGPGCFAL